MDYFDLYKEILLTIRDKKVFNAYDLITELSKAKVVQKALSNDSDNQELVVETLDVLENLVDDGLVKGTITRTKSGTLYNIRRLTTTGRQYLNAIEDDTFWNRVKTTLKEEGIPISPQGISKVITKNIL